MPRKSASPTLIALRLIAAACAAPPVATPTLSSAPSPISITVASDDFAYQLAVAGTSPRLPWGGGLAILVGLGSLVAQLVWRRRALTL
ncbi:MAG: hypothetical protein HY784_06125 [Chloroflexi bacterium]|nr:hypothetical protein [Chloroflexota bacterium]